MLGIVLAPARLAYLAILFLCYRDGVPPILFAGGMMTQLIILAHIKNPATAGRPSIFKYRCYLRKPPFPFSSAAGSSCIPAISSTFAIMHFLIVSTSLSGLNVSARYQAIPVATMLT